MSSVYRRLASTRTSVFYLSQLELKLHQNPTLALLSPAWLLLATPAWQSRDDRLQPYRERIHRELRAYAMSMLADVSKSGFCEGQALVKVRGGKPGLRIDHLGYKTRTLLWK